MLRTIFCFTAFLFLSLTVFSQTREELEKQRAQLKKEIEQTEKMLSENKTKTKENLLQWNLINNKVNLQDRVVENISKDLRLLDNNIYSIQRDINKYDRLLDTLKQEYAKSMVYAYKNRSNYDFLNFIFSADNFNDAIKRVAYLKSYRTYREMQGQNILRTQELRRKRIEEITGVKQKKKSTLEVQSKEMQELEQQKKEQDRILNELKKKGTQLNNQMAAKQRQMKKVSNAIAAAIKKAQDDAKKAALAKAADDAKKAREANAKNNASSGTSTNTKSVASGTKTTAAAPKKQESVLLNSENLALNTSFEKNRGGLPWPVDKGYVLMHYGSNRLPSGTILDNPCTTVSANIGTPVKSVFDGTVTAVQPLDDMQVVIIQHGRYFSTYSNLNGVSVQKGQEVKTGQVIGKVAANMDGDGALDFYMSNENSNFDPEKWLRRR